MWVSLSASRKNGCNTDNRNQVAWDAIGDLFSQQMSLGKWGPDKRREKDSVLKELSQAQLDSYTPDQIAILRAQREKAS